MSKQLSVLVSGVLAGTLTQDHRTSFSYDAGYLARPKATPLSLSMPLRDQPYAQKQALPWLQGILPDNRAVLDRWARQFGVSARNPFALVARMGRDCPGAVQICPPDEVSDVLAVQGRLLPVTEQQLGQRLRTLRQDTDAWTVSGERWSLGGAQSKFAIVERDGQWFEAIGGAATTHIVKPGVTGYAAQGLNEHVSMTAARALGIRAARTRYLEFDGQAAVVVDRYDRLVPAAASGEVRRIHQEDMCQALSVPPAKKYESEGGPGAAVIGDLLRDRDRDGLWRFTEAVAFNYLLGASDAHAKNYSVLLSGDQVRLAPLYDVASSLPYDPADEDSDLHKTAMAIGGHRQFGGITRKNWERFARRAGVDIDRLAQRVSELSEALPDALATAIDATPASPLRDQLRQRLVDRVARHAQETAATIQTAARPTEANPPDPAGTALAVGDDGESDHQGEVHVASYQKGVGDPVQEHWRGWPSPRS